MIKTTVGSIICEPLILNVWLERLQFFLVRSKTWLGVDRTRTEGRDRRRLRASTAKSNGGGTVSNAMKILSKLKTSTLLMSAIAFACLLNSAFAQHPAAAPINLVAGVGGPVSSSNQWDSYSALNLIAGAFIFPATQNVTTTVLYIGFTAGTEADIGNMVLYTTKRGNAKITAVTPVKLKGISNPIISLTNKKVCPIQPVTTANPCVIRLDPIKLTPSVLSDYYYVQYLANNSNNQTLGAANALFPITSLTGWYLSGDQTQLKVGDSIPSGNNGTHPYFLLYVMSN
jgi:hypothetical protein